MADLLAEWTEPLFRQHMLLASDDVDEIRLRVAELLNDHILEPRGATLAARLHGVKAGVLSVCMLEYGEAVTVEETRPAGEFLLLQMPLSGSVDIECDEGSWTAGPGSGVILPSNMPHRLDWKAGATQIILKVPLGRLYAEYGSLTGVHPGKPLKFNRRIDLGSGDGEQWNALMRYFCEQAAQPSPLGWLKARVAEEALMRHLLCAQSISLREHYFGGDCAQVPKRLRRAREFIEAHLHEGISLDDIAEHSGTSLRSLSRMCQLQYGASPMQLLRNLRLDKIRQELLSASVDSNVSEVAMRWGYTHLGRFAAAYRKRFGEAPNETRQAGAAAVRMHSVLAGSETVTSKARSSSRRNT
ncbi:MAG TPA: AraC family transcriptional regulator [Eoetvoesiella sp.]|uniref:AraC family transcriptional regulator n=1 Tax=Eoetvoesiella sp. TaxID=1966355 RepID=UPI002B6174A7|nr:AraC family transcriptional regulator [Eoetvoesiella sp.]HWK60303.1 AraC family transcriptional regulator [Eoetvoesiella sp.]